MKRGEKMLILPIINRGRVMNIEITLKGSHKIRSKVHYKGADEKEIIVNREKYSNSIFQDPKKESAPTEFIRSKSILYPRNFLVTTKTETTSDRYDVYEVSQPPKKVNESLEKLYGKVITDYQNEIPDTSRRGRYVSLQELGMEKELTEEKIAKLKRIIEKMKQKDAYHENIPEKEVQDFKDILTFLQHFQWSVIPSSTIKETSLQDTLKALEVLNSRDYRHLNKYYHTAKTNQEIYTKLSYIHQILYGEPLHLIESPKKEKKYMKTKEENDYGQVA